MVEQRAGRVSSKTWWQTLQTEAEYIAASEAAKECIWINKFITVLGVVPSYVNPIDLCCDNSGAIP